MSGFLLTILRGLYPLYLFFLFLGVWSRISTRKWTAFDSFLISLFVIFELLAAFQVPLFYGSFITSKRYLWIGIPFYIPFAAEGFLWLREKLSGTLWEAVLAGIIAVNLVSIYSPVYHEFHSVKKRNYQEITLKAAEWIRKDWKYRKLTNLPQLQLFKCDEYQSGRRPLVQSTYERVGWLSGGQGMSEFLASHGLHPDYLIMQMDLCPPGYRRVKKMPPVYIYRRITPSMPQ